MHPGRSANKSRWRRGRGRQVGAKGSRRVSPARIPPQHARRKHRDGRFEGARSVASPAPSNHLNHLDATGPGHLTDWQAIHAHPGRIVASQHGLDLALERNLLLFPYNSLNFSEFQEFGESVTNPKEVQSRWGVTCAVEVSSTDLSTDIVDKRKICPRVMQFMASRQIELEEWRPAATSGVQRLTPEFRGGVSTVRFVPYPTHAASHGMLSAPCPQRAWSAAGSCAETADEGLGRASAGTPWGETGRGERGVDRCRR